MGSNVPPKIASFKECTGGCGERSLTVAARIAAVLIRAATVRERSKH
jgi:hypothetical protein